MSSFAALMALSQTQTRQSEAAVQSALAEKKRKDAAKQKAQEEKEKRERDIEVALRKKHLEDMERDKARRKREAEEKARKEKELERKEAEQRDALRYGPKKGKSEYPSARRSGGGRADDSDSEGGGGGLALTREEKRRRRMEQEMRYGIGSSKKAGSSAAYRKLGRRLPGGAIDQDASKTSGNGNYRSIKEKLAAPAGLIQLNTNKRDTRTIDQIVEDLHHRKGERVLQGDNAKEFADWFGKGKAKPKSDGQSQSQSQSQVQSQAHSQAESRASSMFGSPPPRISRAGSSDLDDDLFDSRPASKPLKSASSTPPVQGRSKPVPSGSTLKSSVADRIPARGSSISVKAIGGRPATGSSTPKSAAPARPNGAMAKPAPSSSRGAPASAPPRSSSSVPPARKRPRSPSYSVSPPPAKRRPAPQGNNSISNAIWAMFGKDRKSYVSKDIMSDDEDMEADARDLEKEEAFSARIARREDEDALEAERRHEEEKRRKRNQKDRRGY